MMRVQLVVFFLLIFTKGVSQQNLIVKKDLQSDWLVFEEVFAPYKDKGSPNSQTIYFWVSPQSFKGDYLAITNDRDFSVLINNKLVLTNKRTALIGIDSLSGITTEPKLFIGIRTDLKTSSLRTQIVSKTLFNTKSHEDEPGFKKEMFFHDYSVTAILVLVIFLISIVRLNPRLSRNYFSVTKMFSFRDADDDQVYYRLTSSNILFYVFTSMILAFYLMVISQFVETGLDGIEVNSYFSSVLVWLKISLVIFAFLFVKMVVIYSVTSLFGVSDVAGIHFFNFISSLLISIGLLTLVLAGYFLLHGQQEGFYSFFYKLLIWILGGWVVLLFLKLTNRVQHSVFHLFSYICATEIIPFLLIVKVLNE